MCSYAHFLHTFPALVPLPRHMSYMCFLFFMTHTYGTHKDLSFILALSNECTCTCAAELWVGNFAGALEGPWRQQEALSLWWGHTSPPSGICPLSVGTWMISIFKVSCPPIPSTPFSHSAAYEDHPKVDSWDKGSALCSCCCQLQGRAW